MGRLVFITSKEGVGMYFIGCDLGGTNIATALVDEKGRIIKKSKFPTEAKFGPDHVIKNMKETIYEVMTEVAGIKEIRGIGLGIPGLVDSERGISRFAGNLGWENVPVVEKIKEDFEVPIFMDNDVRVATLGEKYFGAGKNVDNLICITVGTGVGSGIIIGGKLFRGSSGSAGEIGHITVFKDGLYCNCGNRGCLEVYASATGIARRAREYIQAGNYTVMISLVGGDLSKITAETVSKAYDLKDRLAVKIMDETAEILGIGIANYIDLINPEMVIIGGGVSLAGERLLEPLRKYVRLRAMRNVAENVQIVKAELGDESGMVGSAALAMMNLGVLS
ncbi:ROK family protein [Thermoanaerobacterium sp. DL9XJH110]|uniref:ROK family protein n=1 Tax=Thermoanaerobacterium sp. DL9XJH110 TaxID=3386643 RepID=UPI003BB77B9D